MPSEDITFCANEKCNIQNCERNPKNIRNFNILHSFAMFPDCEHFTRRNSAQPNDRG